MGHAARNNPRSPEGGKPRPYTAFMRCVRAVRVFGNDRAGFVAWLDRTMVTDVMRDKMEHIWSELHPAPRVTIETEMPRA